MEFTDFQCPYCRSFNESVRNELIESFDGNIQFVFKHFPLDQIHPRAMEASVASQCAMRDGKFLAMQDLLYKNSTDLATDVLLELGLNLGLSNEYGKCVMSEETLSEVKQDQQDGFELGVKGTPSFLVNGVFLEGAPPLERFKQILDHVKEG